MFNHCTGFKIAVMVSPAGAPFVVVAPDQVDEVCQLFIEKGIGHTLANRLVEQKEATDPQIIHIGSMWDRQRIQDVLDSIQ